MPIYVEATPKGFMAALFLTQTKGIVPDNVHFIQDATDDIMSKTEQLRWLLKDQFTKRGSLVVYIEEVWIVGISGASFEWARELCQTKTHISLWNLITDVTIPDADAIFDTVLFLDDIIGVLWHEFLSKTILHPSIARWKEDYDSGGKAIERLLDSDDLIAMLKSAITEIPKPLDRPNLTDTQLMDRSLEIPTKTEPEVAVQYVSSVAASFYHRESCKSVLRIKKPVYYASIDEAEAAGKKPCSGCHPQ